MQKLNLSDLQKVAPGLEANGISLYDFKVSVSYDTDLANLYFNDFKDGYMNDNINLFFGNRQADYLVIIENETVAKQSYYKKSQLARMKKACLYELLEKNNHDIIYTCNTDDMTKSDMIDCLLEIDNQEYYKNHYDNVYYQDLNYDFAIGGYSQGDYCKVKLVGNVEKWINKEYLTNVFYCTPVSGFIEVFKNGVLIEEFQLYDLKNFDEYADYDKDKLVTMIVDYCKDEDYKDLLIAYLNENLKSSIDYDCIYEKLEDSVTFEVE